MCSTCGAEIESTLHIFKKCPVVRALLFTSKWGGPAKTGMQIALWI